MRRRLLWLLSTWAYFLPTEMLPHIVQLLRVVLDPRQQTSDTVVMIQAIETLKAITLKEEFKTQMLVPEFPALIESMCQLTLSLEDSEHRAKVVDLMGELVLLIGPGIVPILAPIYAHLCDLWQSAEVHSPIRSSVLDTLTRIVRCCGLASDSFHESLQPLLSAVFSHSELDFVRKEACALWLAVVRGADNYSSHLDTIFKEGVPRLFSSENEDFAEPDSELMKSVMIIVEAYAVIGGEHFLESCKDALDLILRQTLCDSLGMMKQARMTQYFLRPVEALLFTAPVSTVKFLCDVGVLSAMLRACAATTPSFSIYFKDFKEEDVSVIGYLTIICRVISIDSVALSSQCAQVLAGSNISGAVFMQELLRLLIDR